MYTKRAEFQMWATEVQKIDIELLPKNEEKELFRSACKYLSPHVISHLCLEQSTIHAGLEPQNQTSGYQNPWLFCIAA